MASHLPESVGVSVPWAYVAGARHLERPLFGVDRLAYTGERPRPAGSEASARPGADAFDA
jgi:hypothetical protein